MHYCEAKTRNEARRARLFLFLLPVPLPFPLLSSCFMLATHAHARRLMNYSRVVCSSFMLIVRALAIGLSVDMCMSSGSPKLLSIIGMADPRGCIRLLPGIRPARALLDVLAITAPSLRATPPRRRPSTPPFSVVPPLRRWSEYVFFFFCCCCCCCCSTSFGGGGGALATTTTALSPVGSAGG